MFAQGFIPACVRTGQASEAGPGHASRHALDQVRGRVLQVHVDVALRHRLAQRQARVEVAMRAHPPCRLASKFLFPEGSGAGISTPSASADPLLAGAGTAASAVVGCSRERTRAASSALADIVAGSRCLPRDVFAAARPLLLARKEERCVGARSRSTSVHSNNSLCSEFGRLVNPPS